MTARRPAPSQGGLLTCFTIKSPFSQPGRSDSSRRRSAPKILRYRHLAARPNIFAAMTGLSPTLFDELAAERPSRRSHDVGRRRGMPASPLL